MTRFLFTASLLLALAWLPATAEAKPEAIAGEVYFDENSRQLYLPWYEGVPAISELKAPYRLVIELPWTSRMGEGTRHFGNEWVQSVRVQRSGLTARVEVRLNKALKGDWHPAAGRGVFSLRVGPEARMATRSQLRPTPKAQPSPAAKPQLRPTPKAQPSPTAEPQLRPTPKAQPSPTAKPQLRPTSKAQPSPTAKPKARPMPKAQPRPTAKPQAGRVPKAQPRPTAKPQLNRVRATGSAKSVSSVALQARAGRFTYDEEVRYFLLPVDRKVTPVFTELRDPPRLVIDLPSVSVTESQNRTYPGALVREATLRSVPGRGSQAILTLARPITNHWKWKQSGNNLVVVFDHRPASVGLGVPSPAAISKSAPPASPVAPTPAASSQPLLKPTNQVPGRAPASSSPQPSRPPATPGASPAAGGARKVSPSPRRVRTGHAFSGTVYNINSGAPLAGVRVKIAQDTAVSDGDGRFELLGIPAGAHSVTVVADGFSPQTFSILVPDDKSISLNLVPSL